MAFRTWGRLLLTALGVSVLAGAGQLGVAYGFGIVRLTGAFTGTTVNQWPAQLVWVGWFAANAAVAGAVLTGRLARRDAPAASTGRQLAIGGAAALGATVIAPLCMQPARAAELISVDPVWAVGICAVLGAVIGAGAAIAVLLRPELGWNMAAVAGAVWLLALISVLPSLGTAGPLPTVRLGVLEPSWLNDAAAQQLALLLLPTVALLAGAATAGLARWRGQAPLVSGATGVAGPVLVAFAYLTAGPGDPVDRYQVSPYYAALIAILAGALGAAAAALLRWPAGTRAADPQAIEPSDILRPLPASPLLPGTASAGSTNDRDTVERTDAQLANTDSPAGQPAGAELTGTELTGTTPGPRAAGGSDGVRTVPAHWDWPATTASGQHGPTPAAPTTPAAWRTDPTTAFSTEALTRRSSRDEATSPADTAPPATDTTSSTGAAPTSTTTGRAGAAAPAGGPADEPTGSATTVTGDRPAATGKDAPTAEPSSAAPSSTGTTSSGTTSSGTTSAGTTSTGTPSTGTTSAGTPSTGTTSAGTPSTGTASASTTSASEADAPLTPKPRRTRKPKVSPAATTSDTSDGAPSSLSETTDETPTGRATKVTRPGKSAERTGPGKATDTPERSTESQDTASGLTTEAIPAAESGTPTAAAAAPTAPTAAISSTPAPAAPTGSTGVPATPTVATDSKTEAADPARTPAATATGPTGSPAEPASGSTAARVDEADSERPATEDSSTAGLFGSAASSDPDADRWTPTAPAWPVASARTVPPQASDPGPATAETGTGPTEPTPRPRHRAPLPDLSRASTWDAFNTTRRAGPAQSSNTARSTSTDSAAASESAAAAEPATRAEPASPTASPVVPGQAATAKPAVPRPQPSPAASPVVPGQAGTPSDAATRAADPATTDNESAAAPTTGVVAEQPSRRGRLGGLFRRKGSRTEEESQEPSAETEPLPTQDEEFVDWVAGLSKPVSDNEPEQESGRRSLRSTGRHYRD
ncbi:hypothetical protein AB0J84_06000 [Micromonospora arborensis]|uniref:hypothetical protein n=1 Tax=Micromonospora arborensis TaxID=2116518 RepID=UPI003435AFFC